MPGNKKTKLKALSEIASIDITLPFEDMFRKILDITCNALSAQSGTITFVDESSGESMMAASYGLPDNYIVPDIAAPMKKGAEVIGMMNIFMKEPHDFSEDEIDFLKIAASHASSIVRNASVRNKETFDSEKYLKTIFNSSLDGIAVVDEHGKFEFANDSLFRIIDWPREEVIGQYFMKIIPEDMREAVKEHWQGIQRDHVGGPHEIKIRTRSGEIRHLIVSSSLDEINGKNKVIAIVHDNSERIQWEQEFKKSEERYRELFENANDPMYTHDLQGNILTLNKIGAEILGATQEEIIGTHISRWLSPESFKLFEDRVRKIYQNQPVEPTVVIEVIGKNGERRWGEARTRHIREGDRIVAVHGIVRDITERIKLEKELRESEARYRELFENANDGMYTHSMDGYVLTVNKTLNRIFEVDSEDELIGVPISHFLTPESFEIAKEIVRKHLSGESFEQPVLLELFSKKKKQLFMEFKTRVIKENDRIVGIHGIARDVTEKIKLEKELKESHEKLERSYRELKESEEKYRDLFENAQDAMYVLDMDMNFLKMNRTGLSILGCTKEEVIGSNLSRWITPDSMKIVNERRKNLLSGEKVNPIAILEVVCKNGGQRWVEIRARQIKDGEKTIEIHGIARDITENRLLKQQLKKTNKQHKLLCYLIQGTRGGKTRAVLLKHLSERSYNANQLATVMNMDYKTIRHHLDVLIKNGIIAKDNDGYSDVFFISKNIEENLYSLQEEQNFTVQ